MTKSVQIFGVPMDLGQRRRGVDMGPSAVRYAGLNDRLRALGYDVFDNGNLSVPLPENELPDHYGVDGELIPAEIGGQLAYPFRN